MAKKEKSEEVIGDVSIKQLDAYLKANKKDHLNYDDQVNWVSSTGSLEFDAELGGGFGPGAYKVAGASFAGKAQPVNEPVLTANGWVPIGSLKIGDKIINSEGGEQEILGVFPQGKKQIYEVIFHSGAKTRCCDEHLWETTTVNEKRYGGKSIKPLSYIRKTLNYGARNNHTIRIVKPIEFSDKDLVLDPYLLGVLLGDGGITERVDITNTDQEIWDYVKMSLRSQFPDEEWSLSGDGITKIIVFKKQTSNPLKNILKEMSLYGLRSHEKFIPEEYLLSPIKDREALLQGLMDTDGFISPSKTELVYYSTSEKLADGVLHLVRSLGGLARKKFKKSGYINNKGERVSCKDCFIISFYLPEGITPCRLTRKAMLYRQRIQSFENTIIGVEHKGEDECVCIKVSSLDSMYVTKDFILTHNTNCVLQCVKNALETIPNSKGLWVKAEGRLDQEVQDRSGVKFVYKAEEWQVGTCFVLETNIFELVTDLINNLIKNNPSEIRYVMGIDSMDGLIRRADMEKDAEEGERVGGGALLTSVMFKKANLVLNKKGHVLFMIHQIRAKIETNQYAPKDQNKSVGGGGANSGVHSSNQVWNFRGRTKQVNIEEKGKVVGHYCVVDLTKGVKEQIDIRVQYPVRHGRKGGKSVWLEYEISNLLVKWELVEKAGSWLKFEKDFILELRSQGFSVGEEKINKETSEKIYEFSVQGDAKLKDWLEENPAITDFLYKKFLKMFTEE